MEKTRSQPDQEDKNLNQEDPQRLIDEIDTEVIDIRKKLGVEGSFHEKRALAKKERLQLSRRRVQENEAKLDKTISDTDVGQETQSDMPVSLEVGTGKEKDIQEVEKKSEALNSSDVLRILGLDKNRHYSYKDIVKSLGDYHTANKHHDNNAADQKTLDQFEELAVGKLGISEEKADEFMEKFFDIKKEGIQGEFGAGILTEEEEREFAENQKKQEEPKKVENTEPMGRETGLSSEQENILAGLSVINERVENEVKINPDLLKNEVGNILEEAEIPYGELTGSELGEKSRIATKEYFEGYKKQKVYESKKALGERMGELYRGISEIKAKKKKSEQDQKDIKLYAYIEKAWGELSDEEKNSFSREKGGKTHDKYAKFNFVASLARERFKNIQINCKKNIVDKTVKSFAGEKVTLELELSDAEKKELERQDKRFKGLSVSIDAASSKKSTQSLIEKTKQFNEIAKQIRETRKRGEGVLVDLIEEGEKLHDDIEKMGGKKIDLQENKSGTDKQKAEKLSKKLRGAEIFKEREDRMTRDMNQYNREVEITPEQLQQHLEEIGKEEGWFTKIWKDPFRGAKKTWEWTTNVAKKAVEWYFEKVNNSWEAFNGAIDENPVLSPLRPLKKLSDKYPLASISVTVAGTGILLFTLGPLSLPITLPLTLYSTLRSAEVLEKKENEGEMIGSRRFNSATDTLRRWSNTQVVQTGKWWQFWKQHIEDAPSEEGEDQEK